MKNVHTWHKSNTNSRKLTRKKLTRLLNFALNFRMKLARLQQIDFEMYEINENVRHWSICKAKKKEKQRKIKFFEYISII